MASISLLILSSKKSKAIPLTGRGDSYGCEMSKRPYFLENRLTDGGEVISFT
jgi:hypothetical protein